MRAYSSHLQAGVIAQGLLQILSVLHSQMVWRCFGSWIRTLRSGIPPSEQVVGMALRHSLPEFLAASDKTSALAKFINDRLDLNRAEGLRLAAYKKPDSQVRALAQVYSARLLRWKLIRSRPPLQPRVPTVSPGAFWRSWAVSDSASPR
jgi:hypothetical protein